MNGGGRTSRTAKLCDNSGNENMLDEVAGRSV
jgi:hypothetical protein